LGAIEFKTENIAFFKKGDIFCFKLNRTQYGFGRVVLDIYKVQKENIIPENHFFFEFFL